MKHSNKQRSGAKRGLLIALCVVLSLVLVALVVLTIALYKWDSWKDQINYVESNSVKNSSLYNQMQEEGLLIEDDENIVNILLIGQDAREGQGRQRSDAMILCSVNKRTKTLTMTSFMRDMYVEIPGYSNNKINAAYALGGMELLDLCLLYNFGVVVDHNIEVDFTGFMGVIDAVGGIDLELTQGEADYLNRWGNWDVDDSTAWTWSLKEGMNHLTGEQALAYSRIRYVGNADFGRTERQRKVLTQLMNTCKELSLSELDQLMNEVLPLITTDMSSSQIDKYAVSLLPILPSLSVNQLRIPGDGAYYDDTIGGMSVLVPDLEKSKQALAGAMQE